MLQGGALDLWQVCSQRGAETPEKGSACREGREAQQAEVNAPRCKIPWCNMPLKHQRQAVCAACLSKLSLQRKVAMHSHASNSFVPE